MCVLSLLLMILPVHGLAAPAATATAIKQSRAVKLTPEQQYANLKQQFSLLGDDKGNAKTAEQWQAVAQSFYQLHQAHRKEALGANALFMTAQVLRLKGQRFHTTGDTQLARQRYLEFVDLYPGNTLADDALYEAAALPNTGPQAVAAETLYAQILSQYPQGDQANKAQKKLVPLTPSQQAAETVEKVAPAVPSTLPTPPGNDQPKQQMPASTPANFASVSPMKFWSSSQYSRLVVSSNSPVPYTAKRISDAQLTLELQRSTLDGKNGATRVVEQGLLKSIQPAFTEQGMVSFTINLESFADFKVFTLQDPFRIVVDIYGQALADQPSLAAKQSPQQATEVASGTESGATTGRSSAEIPMLIDQKKMQPAQNFTAQGKSKLEQLSLAQQLGLGVRTIVIDPGHGGKDPGAMAFGLKEKDIVLKVAQKLANILKQTYQYQVVLTRTKDTFIPLEKRTAMANAHKADLFISIHVNAHADQTSSGIETYFLNLATDADAMRVAALENASSNHSIGELQDILSSLMNNSKIDESSRLARFVQSNLISGLKTTYKARDLGVKQAPFYVLIGAEMPAILAELSFITNPAEAKLLQDDTHLDKLAKQLAGGIVAYIEHHHAAARLQ